MNIAIVSPFNPSFIKDKFKDNRIPNINIAATAVNILVEALIDSGNKVYIYTTDVHGPKVLSYSGRNIELRIVSREFKPGLFRSFRIVNRLRKTIEKDIDDIDVIHAHWTYEYAAATRKFEKKIPVLCTVRDWCPYQRKIVKGFVEKCYWRGIKSTLFAYVMNSSKIQFIANSSYTYKMIHEGYPNKKCIIIPNPVQHAFIIDKKMKTSKEKVFISISASLEEKRKNIDTLLRAYGKYKKENSDSKLYLIGDYSKNWKDAHKKYLDGVVLTGKVDHDEVYGYLDRSDILVHSSLEETFGNILLEAMARCVVCIGGDKSGAVPEVLGYGERGILCDVNNDESIKEAMIQAGNTSITTELVNNATTYLFEKYSDISVAKTHIKLYQKMIDIRGRHH